MPQHIKQDIARPAFEVLKMCAAVSHDGTRHIFRRESIGRRAQWQLSVLPPHAGQNLKARHFAGRSNARVAVARLNHGQSFETRSVVSSTRERHEQD